MEPCWSCGAKYGECFDGCQCEACIDPEGYEDRLDKEMEAIEKQMR